MTRPIPAPILFEALAALRAIKDAPAATFPPHLWVTCMRAHAKLESALVMAQITVPVQAEETPA